jgi:hypothetical protein
MVFLFFPAQISLERCKNRDGGSHPLDRLVRSSFKSHEAEIVQRFS